MHPIKRLLSRWTVALALAAAGTSAVAQDPGPAQLTDDASVQLTEMNKALDEGKTAETPKTPSQPVDDAKLNEFRDRAADLGGQADAVLAERNPKLAALVARGNELGPAPAKGVTEAPDIAAQRTDIAKQTAALTLEIQRASLVSLDSRNLGLRVAEARRARFQAMLSTRRPSPLTPTFWRDVGDNAGSDTSRLGALRDGVMTALRDSFAPDNRWYAIGGVGIGLFVLGYLRWWTERLLMRLTADRVPHGRLRRSALAFAVVVVASVFTGIGAQTIVLGLDWHHAFSDAENSLARVIVYAVIFGAFVAGLGRGLLSAARPSWRLPPIADDVAERLRIFPLLFGGAVAFSILLTRVNSLANASLSATIAASFVIAMVYAGLVTWALLRSASVHSVHAATPDEATPRPVWVGIVLAALWLGVVATFVSALIGYVALGHQIARQMIGTGIVLATLYLLVHLIEDLLAAALSSQAKWAQKTLGLEPRLLDQVAVVCSGIVRIVAVLFIAVILLRPIGTDPGDLLARAGQLGKTFPIGDAVFTPSNLLNAIAVIAFGLLAIRAVQRWLLESYLPTTKLDPGMRSSVTTLLGYVGGVMVVALGLTVLGFSVERIAWVASALSVGIGFGLQAVVQNFVSGLILLIERPVKVGDWVVLGDTEGDIRRINVRATEIQMGDRSTVIVPNSELITKSVRNVTLANAEGRVRVKLPIPLDTDAERVRQIMIDALAAHKGVLTAPAPSVLLDGIEGGSLIFIATAFIVNPRQSGTIRSDLLFDVLARLRKDGIAVSSPYDVKLQGVAAPPAPSGT